MYTDRLFISVLPPSPPLVYTWSACLEPLLVDLFLFKKNFQKGSTIGATVAVLNHNSREFSTVAHTKEKDIGRLDF